MSLVEVILALGLCAILLLTAIELVTKALRSNEKSTDSVTAAALSQETAGTFIYSLPGASAPFWASTATFVNPYQVDSVTLGTQVFQRELDVISLEALSPGLRQIVVKISWANGQNGRSGSGVLTNQISRLVAAP